VPLTLSGGSEQASLQISTLSAGVHLVTATYSGDATDSPSSLVTPLVQTVVASTVSAPSVTRVLRYGYHMHPTVLVLMFDTGLDPSSATNPKNYVLVNPAGGRIGFNSVSYDASADTVTLRPKQLVNLHWNYRLTVIGAGPNGVAGIDLALLDGAGDGRSGTNYVTTLNWKNLVIPLAPVHKYTRVSRS